MEQLREGKRQIQADSCFYFQIENSRIINQNKFLTYISYTRDLKK